MKFNCHMNVEICTTIKSVKYIFKYIHKGNDAAHIEIRQHYVNHDEILQHLNARYVDHIKQYSESCSIICMIRAMLSYGLQFIYRLNKTISFRPGQEERACQGGQKQHSQHFSNSMKRMKMHMNTSSMKVPSITRSFHRKYGGEDFILCPSIWSNLLSSNITSKKICSSVSPSTSKRSYII